MKDFLIYLWDDKVFLIPVAFIVSVVLALFIMVPIAFSEAGHEADLCHAKGGYVIKGGTCINKDSVIVLNP